MTRSKICFHKCSVELPLVTRIYHCDVVIRAERVVMFQCSHRTWCFGFGSFSFQWSCWRGRMPIFLMYFWLLYIDCLSKKIEVWKFFQYVMWDHLVMNFLKRVENVNFIKLLHLLINDMASLTKSVKYHCCYKSWILGC